VDGETSIVRFEHHSRAYLEGLTKFWSFWGSSAPPYSPFCTLKMHTFDPIPLENPTDSRTIENLGELELHFGAAKPAKSIETLGDWVIAWRITFCVTKFIFPHWEKELEDYTEYISSYFASLP
jgi:hypothetical protein